MVTGGIVPINKSKVGGSSGERCNIAADRFLTDGPKLSQTRPWTIFATPSACCLPLRPFLFLLSGSPEVGYR